LSQRHEDQLKTTCIRNIAILSYL